MTLHPIIFASLLLCNLFDHSKASIHIYSHERFVSRGNAFVVHGGSEGIYSSSHPNPKDDEEEEEVSAGQSFIRLEKITIHRSKEESNFSSWPIHALLFEVGDRESIGGSAYGGQRAVCCTSDLSKLGMCKEAEVIHRPSPKDRTWPRLFSTAFEAMEETTSMKPKLVRISRTGMYNLYFIHCDRRLSDVQLEGRTVWKNREGYLPGRMSPLLAFHGFMSLCFLLLSVLWFTQYVRFWKDVIALQNCITCVITLGMTETLLWYSDHVEFDRTGVRPTGTTVWAVTFGSVKRTVARLVILMVSMGYGVVRPTLGGVSSKVVMLGTTFFFASEVLELVEHVGTVSDLSGKARLFFVLPVAVLDSFFIIWIFTSLSATLNKLQAKRMTVKLDLYRKFTNALVVTVLLSVMWICYEIYLKSTDKYNEKWMNAWVVPAFWQFLSFSVLCIICVLWAPSQNSTRYAYSEEANEEFDRDDTLALIKPSQLPLRNSPTLNTTHDSVVQKTQ